MEPLFTPRKFGGGGGSRAPAEDRGRVGAGAVVLEAVLPWPPELPAPPWPPELPAPPWPPELPAPPWPPESPDPPWPPESGPQSPLLASDQSPLKASRAPTPSRWMVFGAGRTVREGGVLSDLCSPCHVFPLLSCPYLVFLFLFSFVSISLHLCFDCLPTCFSSPRLIPFV